MTFNPLTQTELIQQLKQILNQSKNEIATDAEVNLILFYLLKNAGHPKLESLSDLTFPMDQKKLESITPQALNIARERADGKLLQHLLGVQYFLNHDYFVNEHVLVPRPETEILVQAAIDKIHEKIKRGLIPSEFKFAELGLGSGIITGELLSEFKSATAVVSERSKHAIQVAQKNLAQFLDRITILNPDSNQTGFEIFKAHAPFDLILSNPPYVCRTDEIEEQVLNYEPHLALFPDGSPNYFYENFAQHGDQLLGPSGVAYFEIPHERADEILQLFKPSKFIAQLIPDLTGRPRVLELSKEK